MNLDIEINKSVVVVPAGSSSVALGLPTFLFCGLNFLSFSIVATSRSASPLKLVSSQSDSGSELTSDSSFIGDLERVLLGMIVAIQNMNLE